MCNTDCSISPDGIRQHADKILMRTWLDASSSTIAVVPVAGIRPQDIDILVTNCSIYCPTPSLASMLVNHFKLRQDVQSYHLGGMGCGNGVMALSLIRDLLQVGLNELPSPQSSSIGWKVIHLRLDRFNMLPIAVPYSVMTI